MLIVVAMIGIMAAVAIPAYSDYTARAQVSEGLSMVAPAKACVESIYKGSQTVPATNEECGLAPPDQIGGTYTQSITISEDGVITILYRDVGVAATIAGKTIVFQAVLDDQDRLVWDCQDGTLDTRFRPSACR